MCSLIGTLLLFAASPGPEEGFHAALSLAFGAVVGFSLGLTGGGGSIFAVPLLVYGLDLRPREAIGVSLAAVGATALVGGLRRLPRGEFEVLTGLLFAVAGMIGAPAGSWLGRRVPEGVLLSLFAALMLAVAVRMWLQASRNPEETRAVRGSSAGSPDEVGPSCRRDPNGRLDLTSRCFAVLVIAGLAAGVLSGLFGVGGGFVIVPALVLVTGMGIHRAVATSLLVIALVSASGVASHLAAGRTLPMALTGLFVAGGVAGMELGSLAGRRLGGPGLQKLFASAMVAVAAFIVLFFHQRFVPGLAIYSYMVGDEKSKQCAVIDPTRDVDEYLEIARREGLRITHVLETHVHADFVSGSAELKARLGDEAKVVVSGMGGAEWTPPYGDRVVGDGDEITLGTVRLKAIATPGHTPEHVSYALFDDSRSEDTPWLVFTGDFLFVGDVGRPDLLGEEARRSLARQLYRSVFDKLPSLPDFAEVYPGHGAGSLCGKAIGSRSNSSLGYERRFSGALQPKEEPDWISTLLRGMPIAPPYFRRMKKVNAEGPKILGPGPIGLKRFTAREVHGRVCEHCLVLDVRPKEAFAAAHIPGSINIPLGHNLPTWAGWVLPYDRPILIVPDDPDDLPEVVTHLLRVGFDDVQGYLEGGLAEWETHGFDLGRLETTSVHGLAARLAKGAGLPFVLDVRTDGEWDAGHIEGAHHIHGGTLEERYAEVPRDCTVAVVCGSGYRASIASSFLKREGYEDVTNVLGGMTAWNAAGLPVAKD